MEQVLSELVRLNSDTASRFTLKAVLESVFTCTVRAVAWLNSKQSSVSVIKRTRVKLDSLHKHDKD